MAFSVHVHKETERGVICLLKEALHHPEQLLYSLHSFYSLQSLCSLFKLTSLYSPVQARSTTTTNMTPSYQKWVVLEIGVVDISYTAPS